MQKGNSNAALWAIAVILGIFTIYVGFAHTSYVASKNAQLQQVAVVGQQAGSVSGPDISFPYLGINNLITYYNHVTMNVGTTTLCAITSPAATSTIELATWNVSIGTSTASNIDLATGSTAFATSSELTANTALNANAIGNTTWYPSSGTGSVVGPNTFILVKTVGAGLGGYTYRGSCDAEFTVL